MKSLRGREDESSRWLHKSHPQARNHEQSGDPPASHVAGFALGAGGAFYRAVFALVRAEVRRRGDRVTSFHLIHPALRMASCLPAVASQVRAGKWGGFEELSGLAEDFDFEVSPDSLTALQSRRTSSVCRNLTLNKTIPSMRRCLMPCGSFRPGGDCSRTKANGFRWRRGRRSSSLLFSRRRLLTCNGGWRLTVSCTVAVTGDIHDKTERDPMFREFADDDHRVLLCSEVGAEGVDLQFCRMSLITTFPEI